MQIMKIMQEFHKKTWSVSSILQVILIDIITMFGELTDENVKHKKVYRWRATYINIV